MIKVLIKKVCSKITTNFFIINLFSVEDITLEAPTSKVDVSSRCRWYHLIALLLPYRELPE